MVGHLTQHEPYRMLQTGDSLHGANDQRREDVRRSLERTSNTMPAFR